MVGLNVKPSKDEIQVRKSTSSSKGDVFELQFAIQLTFIARPLT